VFKELRGCVLGFQLLFILAYHEGFGLGEEVTGEHLLVLVVVNWVVGFSGENEVGGNEFGALVQELVEGVLGVGGGFTKENGSGGVFYGFVVAGHAFAVGFHGELLEVGREAVEVLIESVSSVSNKCEWRINLR